MKPDLLATLALLREGRSTASRELEKSIAAAQSTACQHVFAQTLFDSARATAAAADPALPLAGLSVSVKDLFDMQGCTSTASSRVLAHAPAAHQDSGAVARLRRAGASIIGRTHMVEFAYAGVGVNPHFGTPAAVDALYGDSTPGYAARIPGGSSSGAGVSVATGAAWLALGSDTGGSIRIPAALNGLVGFKPTARLSLLDGTVPLAPSLDTACALTRSVRDAVLAHQILTAQPVHTGRRSLRGSRLAVPATVFLNELEPAVATAFARSLLRLRDAGAELVEISLPETAELAAINAAGGLTAAESHAWHRHLLAGQADLYDPRVRSRIEKGALLSAADYIDLLHLRRDWQQRMDATLQGFDALVSPTVPITAPLIADVAPADGQDAARDAQRDAAFTRTNMLLLRNTSVVNQLDGCAISLPCHMPGELPMGVMLWHSAMHDDAILDLALQAESVLLSY